MREMGSAGGGAGSVDTRDAMVGRCAFREDIVDVYKMVVLGQVNAIAKTSLSSAHDGQ